MIREGIDCLDVVTAEAAAELVAGGIRFVCRYIGSKGVRSLTRAEVDTLHAAGLDVVMIYETDGQQALGGAAAGAAIGYQAALAAAALGAPHGSTIYVAETDFDAQSDQIGAVRDFYAACQSQLRGNGYGLGVYGGIRVMVTLSGLGAYLWQTYAWSGGAWAASTALQQYQNGVALAGLDCDRDRAMFDQYGQWAHVAPPPPIVEDEDVSLVIIATVNPDGSPSGQRLVDTASGAYAGITTDNAPALPHVTMSNDDFNAFVGGLHPPAPPKAS